MSLHHSEPATPRRHLIALAASLFAAPAFAQTAGTPAATATELPAVAVESAAQALRDAPLASATLTAAELERQRSRSSDVAELLQGLPGVSAYGGGGVASLPALHGLADDRVKVVVDGLPIDNACPNHMNPPLSYSDPQTLSRVQVIAGITPVSLGGDSLGGTIVVDSAEPRFAAAGATLFDGSLNSFYRSNGDAFGGALAATLASERYHLGYSGSGTRARHYDGGGDDGVVRSTEYEKYDQTLKLATQNELGLFELAGNLQHSPYEGFPNQYMDMTFNRSAQGSARYRGVFDWGDVEARGYYRDTEHKMNFLDDKGGTASGGMPMDTRVRGAGYLVKADVLLDGGDTLRIGNELQRQSLNDYWPPVAGSMMMGPDTYINVNGGHRTRLGTFAEWEARWNERWSTLAGVRNDTVWMNTGDVQPYATTGMMNAADIAAAAAFNAADHKKTDTNFDATLLARYQASAATALEFGYAHKTRSPNLYERYAWGRGSMSSRMIGWYGDGNGYVGNLDLDPEVADTVSATLRHSGGLAQPWTVSVTPYYSLVHDYIDADKLADLSNGFVQLQFANHDAELYGLDLAGALQLWDTPAAGRTQLKATASWGRGRNQDDGGSLYHQMPLNGRLALLHALGGWDSQIELVLVDAKTRVDATRQEPETGGYALLNLGTRYRWQRYHVDFGVDNVLDRAYAAPLGGQSIGDFKATGELRPVPGRGRSLNLGLGLSF